MGYYDLNAVVKLTRKSLRITQEELSENVCSGQTLSHLENAKEKVRKDICEKLMQKMKRGRGSGFTMIQHSDNEIIEHGREAWNCIEAGEYCKAEKIYHILSEKLDEKHFGNQQYLLFLKCTIDYHLSRSSEIEYLGMLEKAIQITILNYKEILLDKLPLSEIEFYLILQTAVSYARIGEIEKSIEILLKIKANIEQKYMNEALFTEEYLLLSYHLSCCCGMAHDYKSAIKAALDGIKHHKTVFDGRKTLYLTFELIKNMIGLIDQEEAYVKEERKICLYYLKQVYYIGEMINDGIKYKILEFSKENGYDLFSGTFS